MLDATKAFLRICTTPEEVAGLPPSALGLAAQTAAAKGHEGATAEKGPWAFTLDIPSYQARAFATAAAAAAGATAACAALLQ